MTRNKQCGCSCRRQGSRTAWRREAPVASNQLCPQRKRREWLSLLLSSGARDGGEDRGPPGSARWALVSGVEGSGHRVCRSPGHACPCRTSHTHPWPWVCSPQPTAQAAPHRVCGPFCHCRRLPPWLSLPGALEHRPRSFSALGPWGPLQINRGKGCEVLAISTVVTGDRPEVQSHPKVSGDVLLQDWGLGGTHCPDRESQAQLTVLGEGSTGCDLAGDPGTVAQAWDSQCQGHVLSAPHTHPEACPSTAVFATGLLYLGQSWPPPLGPFQETTAPSTVCVPAVPLSLHRPFSAWALSHRKLRCPARAGGSSLRGWETLERWPLLGSGPPCP